MTIIDALILAGGTGRRLGGVDKAALRLGELSLLDHVLGAVVPVARRIVVVGPPRPVHTAEPVRWTLEEPAGGGPLAGFGAGLEALTDPGDLPDFGRWVLALACDLPFARQAVQPLLDAVTPLTDALPSEAEQAPDAILGRDPDGRIQSLLGAYRYDRTQEALAEHGELTGGSMRAFIGRLSVRTLALPRQASHDVDTPQDMTDLGVTAGELVPELPDGSATKMNGERS